MEREVAAQAARKSLRFRWIMIFRQRTTPYVQALNSSGKVQAQSVSPVSRAGLNGLRYQVLGTDAPHTAEVFGLGDTILLVMYANGTNLQERQGTKPRMTAERAKEWDKPDAFFESLKKSP